MVVVLVCLVEEVTSSTRDVESSAVGVAAVDVVDGGLVDRPSDVVEDKSVTNDVTCCVNVREVCRAEVRLESSMLC